MKNMTSAEERFVSVGDMWKNTYLGCRLGFVSEHMYRRSTRLDGGGPERAR
jgi:hypothetical protein